MSTVHSVDIVKSDGTSLTGVVDPAVVKAAQAYVDSLNPPAPPVVVVGPTPSKSIPANITGDVALAPGSYPVPYVTTAHAGKLYSIDPKNPATLVVPDLKWPNQGGPDCGVPDRAGTIDVVGSLEVADLIIQASPKGTLLTSHPGSTVKQSGVVRFHDGAFYRGSGAKSVTFGTIQQSGTPWAYFISFFDAQVDSIVWDNTGGGTMRQGGHKGSDKGDQGEAFLRLMHGHSSKISNLTVQPWLHDGKNPWKQLIQDRAGAPKGTTGSDKHAIEALDDGSVHDWINIDLMQGQPEIGWMQGNRDPNEVKYALGLSRWTNFKFGLAPRVWGYCKQAQFVNGTVAGAAYSKTINP